MNRTPLMQVTSYQQPKHDDLTAGDLENAFGVPGLRVNSILSQLGWIARTEDNNGWQVTESGYALGGRHHDHKVYGKYYVLWPRTILNNPTLLNAITAFTSKASKHNEDKRPDPAPEQQSSRNKHRPRLKADDGHQVRSKSEKMIDDWLYKHRIVHAYEKKLLTLDGNYFCDFFIPDGREGDGVYIEHWGYNDDQYLSGKQKKLEIYKNNRCRLIEFNETDANRITDLLPRRLLENGIRSE